METKRSKERVCIYLCLFVYITSTAYLITVQAEVDVSTESIDL